MTVLSFNDVPQPVRPLARGLGRALRLLSEALRSVARSWMEWSKFEYELFRAHSHDEDLRA
jgi:hypothetical protein